MTEIRKFSIAEVIRMMGWSNKEAGEILGVSEATVIRKKKGESQWTVTDLKIISERANIPVSQIVF